MNKQKAEKLFNEKGITFIPKHKKIWYSISKFEKYPEMASEGVGRAFGYFSMLIFLFAVILAIGLLFKFHGLLKEEAEFLDKNFTQINYTNGMLNVEPSGINFDGKNGNVVIDTGEITQEKLQKYEENKSNGLKIIWLNNRVIVDARGTKTEFYYKDTLQKFEITEFNKNDILRFFNEQLTNPALYASYAIVMIIYTFIVYFISTLIDILLLSAFGMFTSIIAGIKIRYRAIFNMSVYAFTLSTILKLIYLLISMFTDFEIKYFDLMYTTISFICLAAAIFMIKSDIIKQQMQLMRIIEIKKQEEKEPEEEKKEEKEEKEEPKEEKPEQEPEEKKERKENKGMGNEPQGET